MEESKLIKVKTDIRKRKIIKSIFILSFTIIPIVHFLIFYVYVNFESFLMAFQKPQKGQLTWVGLENFEWVFQKLKNGSTIPTDDLRLALTNTFKTFGIMLCLYPVGIFNAYFVYKKITGYKFFRVVFYLPTVVSSVVVSFFFMQLMSPSGFVPDLLEKLFRLDYNLLNALTDSTFANKTVLFHLIWLGFAGNLIIWGGTFSRIPDSIIESARLDGIGWIRELFQIILPLVWPTVVITLTTTVSGVFGATGAVFLLTGGEYGTQTLSNWIYTRVLHSGNPMSSSALYRVSAMGMLLTIISCTLALLIKKYLTNRIEQVDY